MEWTGQSLGLDLVQEYLWSRGHGQGTTVATRSIFTSALSEMNFQHRHHDMLYLIYYIITANDRDRSPVTVTRFAATRLTNSSKRTPYGRASYISLIDISHLDNFKYPSSFNISFIIYLSSPAALPPCGFPASPAGLRSPRPSHEQSKISFTDRSGLLAMLKYHTSCPLKLDASLQILNVCYENRDTIRLVSALCIRQCSDLSLSAETSPFSKFPPIQDIQGTRTGNTMRPLLTRCFAPSTQRHPCSRRHVVIFSCHLNNSQSRKLRRFPHVERPPNRARTTHEYRCQPPQLQFNSSCLDFPVFCSLFWPLVTYLANVTVSGPTSRIRSIKTIAPIPGFGLWFLHNPSLSSSPILTSHQRHVTSVLSHSPPLGLDHRVSPGNVLNNP